MRKEYSQPSFEEILLTSADFILYSTDSDDPNDEFGNSEGEIIDPDKGGIIF